MPVLEAMASGVAVVSTACSGVLSFSHPGQDCLVAAPGDVEGARGSNCWGLNCWGGLRID